MGENENLGVQIHEIDGVETIANLMGHYPDANFSLIVWDRDAKLPLKLEGESGKISFSRLEVNWNDDYMAGRFDDVEWKDYQMDWEEKESLFLEDED